MKISGGRYYTGRGASIFAFRSRARNGIKYKFGCEGVPLPNKLAGKKINSVANILNRGNGQAARHTLRTFKNMSEVELVDGNQIFHSHGVFLYIQHTRSAKIDDAISFQTAHYFADAVKLRARSVIHQITKLDIIIRPPVERVDNRESVKSI